MNSPINELLLNCARTKASPERIRSLTETRIDWNYFFLLARRHAVVPLVYRQLKQIVPQADLALFKQHYQENSARNAVLAAELCRLIELFANSGIEAIPYKGPILSLFAYDDLALRRFVDLDVIIKKSDFARARDLLLVDNYALSKPLTLDQQELLLRTQHNLQFAKDNRQLIVELHWEVAPHLFASSVQGETLWRNLVPFELNGTRMKTLSADDLLFSLCVHGSRHLWERLGWICDVAELISRRSLDWGMLLDRAAKADSERMFLLGLYLAEKLLETPHIIERKHRRTSLQRSSARPGNFFRDIQIQPRRATEPRRAHSLPRTHAPADRQRCRRTFPAGGFRFCLLFDTTLSPAL
jgi:hypothetical protein